MRYAMGGGSRPLIHRVLSALSLEDKQKAFQSYFTYHIEGYGIDIKIIKTLYEVIFPYFPQELRVKYFKQIIQSPRGLVQIYAPVLGEPRPRILFLDKKGQIEIAEFLLYEAQKEKLNGRHSDLINVLLSVIREMPTPQQLDFGDQTWHYLKHRALTDTFSSEDQKWLVKLSDGLGEVVFNSQKSDLLKTFPSIKEDLNHKNASVRAIALAFLGYGTRFHHNNDLAFDVVRSLSDFDPDLLTTVLYRFKKMPLSEAKKIVKTMMPKILDTLDHVDAEIRSAAGRLLAQWIELLTDFDKKMELVQKSYTSIDSVGIGRMISKMNDKEEEQTLQILFGSPKGIQHVMYYLAQKPHEAHLIKKLSSDQKHQLAKVAAKKIESRKSNDYAKIALALVLPYLTHRYQKIYLPLVASKERITRKILTAISSHVPERIPKDLFKPYQEALSKL